MRSIYQNYRTHRCIALFRFAAKRWFKDELASNKKLSCLTFSLVRLASDVLMLLLALDRVHLKMHSSRGLFVREFIIKRCAVDWPYFFLYALNDFCTIEFNLCTKRYAWPRLIIHWSRAHTPHVNKIILFQLHRFFSLVFFVFLRMHFILFCIVIFILFTTIDN